MRKTVNGKIVRFIALLWDKALALKLQGTLLRASELQVERLNVVQNSARR